jgi:hypothetical protein
MSNHRRAWNGPCILAAVTLLASGVPHAWGQYAGPVELLASDNTPYAGVLGVPALFDAVGGGFVPKHQGYGSPSSGLVLWNKLGSESEVQCSEVGLNGNIVGASYAFEPAKYGRGYVRKARGSNFIEFPGSVRHQLSHQGTVEL